MSNLSKDFGKLVDKKSQELNDGEYGSEIWNQLRPHLGMFGEVEGDKNLESQANRIMQAVVDAVEENSTFNTLCASVESQVEKAKTQEDLIKLKESVFQEVNKVKDAANEMFQRFRNFYTEWGTQENAELKLGAQFGGAHRGVSDIFQKKDGSIDLKTKWKSGGLHYGNSTKLESDNLSIGLKREYLRMLAKSSDLSEGDVKNLLLNKFQAYLLVLEELNTRVFHEISSVEIAFKDRKNDLDDEEKNNDTKESLAIKGANLWE